MYPILLHRDGAQAETYSGPHGDPSPPYTGRSGGGGRVRERELGPRDHVTCYVIAWPCHVTVSGRREGGGTHKRHRLRDERARSTLALCRDLTVNTHGLRTFFMRKHGRPSVAHALGFLLIARLILILKGYI